MITFYMAEQTVLEILFKSDILENGSSPFEDMFDAILVDEYQDTNSLQDMLFSILSKEGKKLFCVGDMKQCIYKFRGSNPTNFLIKKSNSVSLDKFDENSTLRVSLGCNFRSRSEVCDFINSIFEQLIYVENSGFDYDENEMLVPMALYPDSDAPKVENHLFDFKSLQGNGSSDFKSKLYAEAEFTAAKIKELIDMEAFLRCGDTLRKARYGDITILVRSMRNKGDVFIKVLKEKGIPVSAATSEVLDSDESKTLIAFLKLINNPTDDIALLTVLSSPLFGFTFSEIAEIRSVKKYGSVISAVTVAAEKGNEKAGLFLNTLERLRRKSIMVSCGMLIDEIFEETNMLNIYSFGDYGEVGRMNLLCIQNLAFSYEKNGSKSLREFINYIIELDDKDIAVSAESSDSVKIMTIHKSKGLQFPICILANAGNQFNRQDINDSVIVNEDYGFSIAYTDAFGVKTDGNILRSIMRSEEKNHLLAEELRVFYVALTRAEEMLITLSSFTDIDKEIAKKLLALKISNSVHRIEPTLFDKNISYADWLLEIFLLKGYIDPVTKQSKNELVSIHRNIDTIDSVKTTKATHSANHTDVEKLIEHFRYKYPYNELLELQSKSSVSDIVHKADEELYRFTQRPAFLQSKQLSYSEIGTAVHKVMQYVDYEKATISLEDELDRLYEYMYLTDAELEAVRGKNLKAFFSSSLCRRIIASPLVKKEFKFLREISATELIPTLDPRFSGEMVVIQGAVDLVFQEDGKLFITDFKTDRCKNDEQLIASYREQLILYASACEKIFSKPIGGLYLYSFELQKTIEIK